MPSRHKKIARRSCRAEGLRYTLMPILACTAVAALWLLGTVPALAASNDFSGGAFLNTVYDSNLFLLPGYLSPSNNKSRSSLVTTVGAKVALKLPFGRQSLNAGATVQNKHYTDYQSLNYTGGSAHLDMLLGIGPNWTGKAGYSYTRQAVSFADNISEEKNLYRLASLVANADYRKNQPGLESGFGFNKVDLSYTLPLYSTAKTLSYIYHANLTWLTLTGFRFGVQDTYTRGEFPNRVQPTSDTQPLSWRNNDIRLLVNRESRLGTIWSASIGYAHQMYPTFGQALPDFGASNFSAFVGSFNYFFFRSRRLGGEISVSRSVYAVQTPDSNFVIADNVELTPTYKLTEKIKLLLDLGYARLDYQGRGATRQDRVVNLGLSANWKVSRHWLADVGYSWQHRTSNLSRFEYNDSQVEAGLRYSF